jgi:hypothetical protein
VKFRLPRNYSLIIFPLALLTVGGIILKSPKGIEGETPFTLAVDFGNSLIGGVEYISVAFAGVQYLRAITKASIAICDTIAA